MERRIAEMPAEEWHDVQNRYHSTRVCPRLSRSRVPRSALRAYTDGEGNLASRPVYDDGQPVLSKDALNRRDRLIEQLASLPPVQGALDQVIQRFGTDMVAEVTGRSRRIICKRGQDGIERLCVESRPAGANLAETSAFQDDDKRILVFSDAGGTGRSYHADLSARNQRLRVHYLLEAGWKADAAIQGPGPHQPHASGAAATLPANCYGCPWREALPVYHRATARHARRDHARSAPDRWPGHVPRRRQSGE